MKRRRPAARRLAAALLAAAAGGVLGSSAATAQELQVQVSRGPHYAGTPVEIQIVAVGFEEEPEPTWEAPPPPRGELRFQGVSPSVSSSISIVGGRVTQMREVRFVYEFAYEAEKAGEVQLGPFTIVQGATRRTSAPVRLALRELATSDRLGVELRLPEAPVYVGQRVPVTLDFRLERDLQQNLQDYSLRVPFFALSDSFRFVDDPPVAGETKVRIQAGGHDIELEGSSREVREGGRRILVVTLQRTVVPLRTGSYTVEPSTVVAEEGTNWRRDFFGRRATQVRKWRSTDVERHLEVREVPAAGMPESFAGAVGRGFSLEVTADRSVVQAGEPITLTLRLRGDGNLETAALPPLDAEGLLPADLFRVPDSELPGRIDGDTKEFSATVRVLEEGVREVPALEYSWFDPVDGVYRTTRSRPIALSVGASRVVGAADVVRNPAGGGPRAPEAPAPDRAESADAPLVLTGADLAIERDPGRLLRDPRSARGGPWVAAGLYGLGVLTIGLAVLDRRRGEVDPGLRRRRSVIDGERRRVRESAGRAEREAVAEIASALRRMRAECPEAATTELEAFLGECDARSYAPEGRSGGTLDPGFHRRAVALADSIAESIA